MVIHTLSLWSAICVCHGCDTFVVRGPIDMCIINDVMFTHWMRRLRPMATPCTPIGY